jgi:hypothetical protein
MLRKIVSYTVVLTILALVLPLSAAAQSSGGSGVTVSVTGKAQNGPRVTGTFTIQKFVATGDPAHPVGALGNLVLKTADGRLGVTQATIPVSFGTAPAASGVTIQQLACEILDLTLGPLDLSLLGLEIHLDTVHLTIEANPAGGLLGQLLCAIANLLGLGDILGVLDDLLGLLNQLLGLLSGL